MYHIDTEWEVNDMKQKEKLYMNASEIAEALDVSLSTAYKIVKNLNNSLAKDNYIVVAGRVSRAYFNERYYGASNVRG